MPLSPMQHRVLMIGVPVVAVFALIVFMSRRSKSSSTPTTGTTTPTDPSAIGLGDLASFENQQTALYDNLAQQLSALEAQGATTPSTGSGSTGSVASHPPAPAVSSQLPTRVVANATSYSRAWAAGAVPLVAPGTPYTPQLQAAVQAITPEQVAEQNAAEAKLMAATSVWQAV